MNRTIILASASPRRRELLHQIGIWPEIIPSLLEEVITSKEPPQIVMELSAQKAEDIASGRCDGSIVIGADTIVAVEGRILGKPESVEDAVQMITSIQGKVHQVYTGVTLIDCGTYDTDVKRRSITWAEKTEVWVWEMSGEEIRDYAASGEPMDKAGAYGIQGRFAAFIRGIQGDYNNVVGLPVGRVYQELKNIEKQGDRTYD